MRACEIANTSRKAKMQNRALPTPQAVAARLSHLLPERLSAL